MAALAPFAGTPQLAPARISLSAAPISGAQPKSLLDWLKPTASAQRTSTSTFTQPSWVRPEHALANKRRPVLLGAMAVVAVATVTTAVWLGVRRAQLSPDISAAVPSHGLSAAHAPEPTPDSPSKPAVTTPSTAPPLPVVEQPEPVQPLPEPPPQASAEKPSVAKPASKPAEPAQRTPARPAVKPPTERDTRSPVWTR